jgi:hypothetical protein
VPKPREFNSSDYARGGRALETEGRNIMTRRTTLTLTTMALLGLAVATALPQAGFAQSANPWMGTWQTNLAKSTFSPGPPRA